jgi:hypothetical protein
MTLAKETVQVAPAYSGKELGIGDAILIKSVAQASGRQEAQVKKEYNELGDLGEVACNSKGKQRTMFAQKPLTVRVRGFECLRYSCMSYCASAVASCSLDYL